MPDLTAIASERGGMWWLRLALSRCPEVRIEVPPGSPPIIGPFSSEDAIRVYIEARVAWSELAALYGHRRWIEDHVTARRRAEAVAGMTRAATKKGTTSAGES